MGKELNKDISTEEKIKAAAFKLFRQKGFSGTKTRDIAEEAGINLALLNYYYRSKEKLFEIVMEESLGQLFSQLQKLIIEESTSLSEKINEIVDLYVSLLKENQNLPLFILGEIQSNPEKFKKQIGIPDITMQEIAIIRQAKEQMKIAGIENMDPFHMIINLVSMTIFPFAAKPMIKVLARWDDEGFDQFIEERRKLIPVWIKSMLKLNE